MNASGDLLVKRVFSKHSLYAVRDCAQAFSILHLRGMVHLDGKWGNILIKGDLSQNEVPIQAKLSDFEFSCPTGTEAGEGTLYYLSPEQHEALDNYLLYKASPKHDSFALGVMICEIAGRIIPPLDRTSGSRIPFGCLEESYLKYMITDTQKRIRSLPKRSPQTHPINEIDMERGIKIKMLDIAIELVKMNPEQRLSCGEAALKLNQIIENNYPSN